MDTFSSVCSIWEVVWADLEACAMLLWFRRLHAIFEGSFGCHFCVIGSSTGGLMSLTTADNAVSKILTRAAVKAC